MNWDVGGIRVIAEGSRPEDVALNVSDPECPSALICPWVVLCGVYHASDLFLLLLFLRCYLFERERERARESTSSGEREEQGVQCGA